MTHTTTNASSVPTFVRFASWSSPMKPAKPAARNPTTIVLIHGVLNFEWTVENGWNQTVTRHRVEDPRLAVEQHEHHGGEAGDGADLHQDGEPRKTDLVDGLAIGAASLRSVYGTMPTRTADVRI